MRNETSILLLGEAGQGIKTIEYMMVKILERRKNFFFISREYMSRVRGGVNSTQVVISDDPVNSFREKTDLLLALTDEMPSKYNKQTDKNTKILNNDEFLKIALENGNVKYANSVAFGYICAFIGAESSIGKDIIKETYESKPQTLDGNIKSYEEGFSLFSGKGKKFKEYTKKCISIDVSQAVAYGALFGGCNFVSAYPMSPSTAVLTHLAALSNEYDVLVEQAEDEIAAINMVIGASYAGARSMVTTSGGGFALMGEGVSLAGVLEMPVVILLAQRPGPATGLPTRTEQGDFNLALYSGHGDFQRVIYSPGDQIEAMKTTMSAFNAAQKYQIPAIVLADQYILDSVKPVLVEDIPKPDQQEHIVKTDSKYMRYEYTQDGISSRGVPGFGNGVIRVDSDEHDQEGRITEDAATRKKMVEKRNKRLTQLQKEALMPTLIGPKEYKVLFICHGSNLGHAIDLKAECKKLNCAFLHFSQIYPLNDKVKKYFKSGIRILAVENNYTGQFADHIEKRFNIKVEKRILKYDGDPFSKEEILRKIKEVIL